MSSTAEEFTATVAAWVDERVATARAEGAASRDPEIAERDATIAAIKTELDKARADDVSDAETIARLTAALEAATKPPSTIPAGYRLLRAYDLSRDEGWTCETGKPSNADGRDRAANVLFGQGPAGRSMMILGNRDAPGGTFNTGDAKALFAPIPNHHRVRAVIEYDPMSPGMWPAIWERPAGAGDGEIDLWERFGGHGQYAANAAQKSWPVDAGTLHTTPYDGTHKQLSRGFPELTPGRHVIEGELAPTGYTWWVDGIKVGSISPSQFDAAAGRPAWAPMFGQAGKNWYLRVTLQAGGSEGGPIPADLMQWRFWVHELATYVPA